MIVEHVNVNEGGQAIVGTVNQGGAKKQWTNLAQKTTWWKAHDAEPRPEKEHPAKHRLWQTADVGYTEERAQVHEHLKVLSGQGSQIGSMGNIQPLIDASLQSAIRQPSFVL